MKQISELDFYEYSFMQYLIELEDRKEGVGEEKLYKKYDLDSRVEFFNKQFEFSPENMAKIEKLNSALNKVSKRIFKEAEKLEEFLLSKTNEKFLSNCTIKFEVVYYSNKYKHLEDFDGNPVYTCKNVFDYIPLNSHDREKSLNWIFKENHNEFRFDKKHPLKDQHHCWLMKDLYSKWSYLSWHDIVEISDIYPDIQLKLINMDVLVK
ncbi:MAG: hypothetical protein HC905_32025 [Bacteroidales bacterium]|nr:hypothetical protein [Bacteroidales bacterium]